MTDKSENDPATAEQLAAIDFEPIPTEDAEAMFHDFSAEPWRAECANHGVALRIAWTLLTREKQEVIEATEAMERDYSGDGAGPTAEILRTMQHSRERLRQLSDILNKAELRQMAAAAVLELKYAPDRGAA